MSDKEPTKKELIAELAKLKNGEAVDVSSKEKFALLQSLATELGLNITAKVRGGKIKAKQYASVNCPVHGNIFRSKWDLHAKAEACEKEPQERGMLI